MGCMRKHNGPLWALNRFHLVHWILCGHHTRDISGLNFSESLFQLMSMLWMKLTIFLLCHPINSLWNCVFIIMELVKLLLFCSICGKLLKENFKVIFSEFCSTWQYIQMLYLFNASTVVKDFQGQHTWTLTARLNILNISHIIVINAQWYLGRKVHWYNIKKSIKMLQ